MSRLLLILLFLLQGLVAAMYYALANTRKSFLKERAEEGSRRAHRVLRLTKNATAIRITGQYVSILLTVLNTVVLVKFFLPEIKIQLQSIGLSNDGATLFSFAIIIPAFAFLIQLIGFQLPGAIVSGRIEQFAMFSSRPMSFLVYSLAPLLRRTNPISQKVGKMLGGSGTTSIVTEEEIKILIDASSEGGAIDDDEKEMIFSVFRFGDTLAREVMVPRIDIKAIELNASLEEALDKVIEVGHSRIPVYEDSIDNIRGLLYAKDLLSVWRSGEHEDRQIKDILRDPYLIPESKSAGDLLAELQAREIHLAIVIDEYGGTAGLVTIEDLLEEIVGEIRDEYDAFEEPPYEKISDREYIFISGFDLDNINEKLGIDLPTDENDTLGGYIFTELGKLPQVGDTVTGRDVIMEVLTLDGRRIHKIRVTKTENTSSQSTPTVLAPETTSIK